MFCSVALSSSNRSVPLLRRSCRYQAAYFCASTLLVSCIDSLTLLWHVTDFDYVCVQAHVSFDAFSELLIFKHAILQ